MLPMVSCAHTNKVGVLERVRAVLLVISGEGDTTQIASADVYSCIIQSLPQSLDFMFLASRSELYKLGGVPSASESNFSKKAMSLQTMRIL